MSFAYLYSKWLLASTFFHAITRSPARANKPLRNIAAKAAVAKGLIEKRCYLKGSSAVTALKLTPMITLRIVQKQAMYLKFLYFTKVVDFCAGL